LFPLKVGNAWPSRTFTRSLSTTVFKTDTSIIFTVDGKPVYTATGMATYRKYQNVTNAVINQDGYSNIYGATN
jgi:hypothetical protein